MSGDTAPLCVPTQSGGMVFDRRVGLLVRTVLGPLGKHAHPGSNRGDLGRPTPEDRERLERVDGDKAPDEVEEDIRALLATLRMEEEA